MCMQQEDNTANSTEKVIPIVSPSKSKKNVFSHFAIKFNFTTKSIWMTWKFEKFSFMWVALLVM